MPVPDFTDTWDGGAVLESSGLVSINGVSMENAPDWHSFAVNFGSAIRGTVLEASRDAFLAAIEAGSTGLPLTVYECHCVAPHLVSAQVEFDASWPYVIRGDALQPWGHSVEWKNEAARHVIVTEEITWTFSGDTAVGVITTDPALNRWGFVPYLCPPAYDRTWEEPEFDDVDSVVSSNFDVVGFGGSGRFVKVGSATGAHGFPTLNPSNPWGFTEEIEVSAGVEYQIYVQINKGASGSGTAVASWRGVGGAVLSTVTLKSDAWAANTWYELAATETAPTGADTLTIDLSGQLASWNLDRLTVTPDCG